MSSKRLVSQHNPTENRQALRLDHQQQPHFLLFLVLPDRPDGSNLWIDIHCGAANWFIHAACMKMRRPYPVPLSRQMIAKINKVHQHRQL